MAARHAIIRKVEADMGRPICILADLQGPKLRVGVLRMTRPSLRWAQISALTLIKRRGTKPVFIWGHT